MSGKIHIKNTGNIAAKKSSTVFYLSSDAVLDDSDIQFKNLKVPKINKNKSFKYSFNIKLPREMNINGKYIIATLDNASIVSEIDETNNTIAYGPFP